MSVTNTDSVDAAGVRDAWFVVTIHAFENWAEIDDPVTTFRAKLETAFDHLRTSRTLARACMLPAQVELVSRDPVPVDIRAICRDHGVIVVEGD